MKTLWQDLRDEIMGVRFHILGVWASAALFTWIFDWTVGVPAAVVLVYAGEMLHESHRRHKRRVASKCVLGAAGGAPSSILPLPR